MTSELEQASESVKELLRQCSVVSSDIVFSSREEVGPNRLKYYVIPNLLTFLDSLKRARLHIKPFEQVFYQSRIKLGSPAKVNGKSYRSYHSAIVDVGWSAADSISFGIDFAKGEIPGVVKTPGPLPDEFFSPCFKIPKFSVELKGFDLATVKEKLRCVTTDEWTKCCQWLSDPFLYIDDDISIQLDIERTKAEEVVKPSRTGEDGGEDIVEQSLSNQPLDLYLFLRSKDHWTNFDTLRQHDDFWRKPGPGDATIERALRRLRNDLNTIESLNSLNIDKDHRRTKLDR